MTTATVTAPITATFGGLQVTAYRTRSRFFVHTAYLLDEDHHDRQIFLDALDALVNATGWHCNASYESLAGALMADWEPAHIFVAMNLVELEKYANNEWAHFRDAEHMLWDLMRLPSA